MLSGGARGFFLIRSRMSEDAFAWLTGGEHDLQREHPAHGQSISHSGGGWLPMSRQGVRARARAHATANEKLCRILERVAHDSDGSHGHGIIDGDESWHERFLAALVRLSDSSGWCER